MARAAVIPGVVATEQPPAARATRGRGRAAKSTEMGKTVTEPAKRGRKPGKTATAADTKQKRKTAASSKKEDVMSPVDEDESTDDEIGLDAAKINKKPAAASKIRSGRPLKSAVSPVENSDQDRNDIEEMDDEDDEEEDELAQLQVTKKKVVRPKAKTASKAEKSKSGSATSAVTAAPAATKPTRGRPKAVKDVKPVAEQAATAAATTTTTTRKTRGRPAAAKPETDKTIYVATASTTSSFAKARPTGEPARRKKVTFADLSDSEDEASTEEQTTAKGSKQSAAAGKASQTGSGLKAKPVRKTAGGTTGRGRPAKSRTPATKPLSPKKATQLAKASSSSASSGEDDELAGEKTVYSLVVRSPVKNQVQHTGLSSPVKKINFTGSTATPSRPATRMENDENSLPGIQPSSAVRDAAFLGSPARRPPPSASKESLKDTPRRGPLFNNQFSAPNAAHAEASTPTRLSPLKVSPKKGANFGASFLASPEKGGSTPFNAKLSFLQSPAKRIQSPFVFQKVGKSLSLDEDVDMDENATSDNRAAGSNQQVDEFSDDELSMDIKPSKSAESSDDVFVDQPAMSWNEQQDMPVEDGNEQGIEDEDYELQEEKENVEPVESEPTETVGESHETQSDDNMPDCVYVMYVEDQQAQDDEVADIPDHIEPVENDLVDAGLDHTQDDEMEEVGDDAARNPDEQVESEAEIEEPENTEEVELGESKTHEMPSTDTEPPLRVVANDSPEEDAAATNDHTEDAVMHGECEDEGQSVSEIRAPESPAMSLTMSINSRPAISADEIDEVGSAETTRTSPNFVPPAAPSPPTNPAHMHSLMFSYRDNRRDTSSEYDPSPMKRRSVFSTRESILPQTPSASVNLSFSPLAAQLSQWKASSPEKSKAQADRPQSSIFSPVIPSQLRMKPAKNRYSQIQTMRRSLAARHSLANSISMDDDETDTVERQSEQEESKASDKAPDAVLDAQSQGDNDEASDKSSSDKSGQPRLAMSITPVRVTRDAHRTVHTVSRVPLRPEGEVSPIKFPRKRARAGSIDIELPIRASPNRVKLVPKSRLRPSVSPRKPLAEIEPEHVDAPDSSLATASPAKTPRQPPKNDEQCLRGAVVFVDVHTTEGEDASGIFVELLTQMGAKCVKSWSWNPRASQSPVDGVEPVNNSKVGITHVVYKDGGVRTMEKVRQAGDLVKCVGVGWVLDCERENKWLDESRYNVDSTIIPRGGAKRRKSMQPRALANINGSLTSSTSGSRPSRSSAEWEGTMENFRRMSPSTPPSAGESFLSKITDAPPKTPTPGNSEGTYTFNFDFSAMSPATPYFLSQPSKLVQQTCPPKQTNQGLFTSTTGEFKDDEKMSLNLRAKLEAARRKSLAFKPRLESPLSQS